LSASTSHASDPELDSIVIKPVIVDTICLDNFENSCLIDGIRPNCYLLKSHRPCNNKIGGEDVEI
jgi:hypothetical protein